MVMARKFWRRGERSVALCPTCRARRETVFAYRDVPLEKSGVTATNVLVGVCTSCDTIASIPQQSAARLKDVRRPPPKKTEVRISRELQDVLFMLATEYGGVPKAFGGAVVRYYLRQARHDPKLARRLARLAQSPEAAGIADARLSFAAVPSWYEDLKRELPSVALPDRSALVRGVIVAAKEDAFDKPRKGMRKAFEAIAEAALV